MNKKTFHLPGTIGLVLGLTVPAMLGETIELKDRHGIPLVALSDVKMFRYSDYFMGDGPEFQATVKNLTPLDISVPLDVTIQYKDGSVQTLQNFISVGSRKIALKPFMAPPFPWTRENFSSVKFAVSDSFLSPEDERQAAEAIEKKQAAERVKKERESAARRQQIRAICTHVYKSTSDKKVSDLTVKEDQSVRSCQSLGLYPPR